jgi:hypothetical protein
MKKLSRANCTSGTQFPLTIAQSNSRQIGFYGIFSISASMYLIAIFYGVFYANEPSIKGEGEILLAIARYFPSGASKRGE